MCSWSVHYMSDERRNTDNISPSRRKLQVSQGILTRSVICTSRVWCKRNLMGNANQKENSHLAPDIIPRTTTKPENSKCQALLLFALLITVLFRKSLHMPISWCVLYFILWQFQCFNSTLIVMVILPHFVKNYFGYLWF